MPPELHHVYSCLWRQRYEYSENPSGYVFCLVKRVTRGVFWFLGRFRLGPGPRSLSRPAFRQTKHLAHVPRCALSSLAQADHEWFFDQSAIAYLHGVEQGRALGVAGRHGILAAGWAWHPSGAATNRSIPLRLSRSRSTRSNQPSPPFREGVAETCCRSGSACESSATQGVSAIAVPIGMVLSIMSSRISICSIPDPGL